MPIVITPNLPPAAAPSATTADIVLQPGSVISARVVQILGNDQVRIAIGGQAIDVLSQVPLQAGQTLQLQVSQTAGGIGLAVVDQQSSTAASQALAGAAVLVQAGQPSVQPSLQPVIVAAPATTAAGNPLTALETLAVSLAAQNAATQQTSLAPLFANLGVAAGLVGLPPQVQQAVAQVLAQQTSLDQNLTGGAIKQAFQSSGLFLEASLASGSALPSTTTPDLKAALIVLRQVLTTSLASATAAATPGAAVAASAAPQGTTPTAVLQGSTPVEVVLPEGTTGTTPATLAQPGPNQGAAVLAQAGQPSVQPSLQPVIIVAAPETPVTLSPPIAPQLAAAASAPAASPPNAASVIAQEILDLAAASQILPSAATPADAAARAAASSAALNRLQETLQAGALAAGNSSNLVFENGQLLSLIPVVSGARTPAIDDAEFARTNLPPPPINGALPAAQPVVPATLAPHAPVETTLHHLLTDTDGAIARQTLLQVASLPGQIDTTPGRLDPSAPRWNFEIPFATPQGTAMAQFEISRDGGREVDAASQVWRARFSLDVEPAGPIHALVSLSGERTSVRMWAERPATASQLRAGVSQLSQALSRAELQPGDIVVRDGAPVQPASAPAGHFLDRAL
jgi:Flagellar hook-length control protein FliK